jgi:hypothetical protein
MPDAQYKTPKGITYSEASATSTLAEGKVKHVQLDEIIVDPANQDAVQGDDHPYVDGRQSPVQGPVGATPEEVFASS